MTTTIERRVSKCCGQSVSRPTPGVGPWSCDNCHRETQPVPESSFAHYCEDHLVERGTTPDASGRFACWDECEVCERQYHHRTDSVL